MTGTTVAVKPVAFITVTVTTVAFTTVTVTIMAVTTVVVTILIITTLILYNIKYYCINFYFDGLTIIWPLDG